MNIVTAFAVEPVKSPDIETLFAGFDPTNIAWPEVLPVVLLPVGAAILVVVNKIDPDVNIIFCGIIVSPR